MLHRARPGIKFMKHSNFGHVQPSGFLRQTGSVVHLNGRNPFGWVDQLFFRAGIFHRVKWQLSHPLIKDGFPTLIKARFTGKNLFLNRPAASSKLILIHRRVTQFKVASHGGDGYGGRVMACRARMTPHACCSSWFREGVAVVVARIDDGSFCKPEEECFCVSFS